MKELRLYFDFSSESKNHKVTFELLVQWKKYCAGPGQAQPGPNPGTFSQVISLNIFNLFEHLNPQM